MLTLAFFIYILKSGLCLSLLYGLYRLLLSATTCFRFNRVCLLGGTVVCMLLPFLSAGLEEICSVPIGADGMWGMQSAAVSAPSESLSALFNSALSPSVLAWVSYGRWVLRCVAATYVLGALWVGVKWGMGYVRLYRFLHRSAYVEEQGIRWIVTGEAVSPFSWKNYIVLNRSDYESGPAICLHERMHCRHGHCYDNLWLHCLLVVHWYNPAVWKLWRELAALHEYQADEGVLEQGMDATAYQLLLVRKAAGPSLYSMACGLTHSSLKKRILMMSKTRNSKWVRLRMLWAVPLAVGAVSLFASPGVKKFTGYCELVAAMPDVEETASPQSDAPAEEVSHPRFEGYEARFLAGGRTLETLRDFSPGELQAAARRVFSSVETASLAVSLKFPPRAKEDIVLEIKEVLRHKGVRKLNVKTEE